MPENLILVRHGNFTKMLMNGDGPLSPLGANQCKKGASFLQPVLETAKKVTILTPPLLRTMGTVSALLLNLNLEGKEKRLFTSPDFFILFKEVSDWRKIKSFQGELPTKLKELKASLIQRVVNGLYITIYDRLQTSDIILVVGNEPFISTLSDRFGGDSRPFEEGEARILRINPI